METTHSIRQAAIQSLADAITRGLEPLRISSPLRLSEWAERNFYLSPESSYTQERWKAYPFQTAIMDAMGSDDIEEVDLKKSARVGYTKMLTADIGYNAEHKRRNQCIWQPTDDDSDDFCKGELEPMLRDVPAMERVFPAFMRKNKSNTLRQKRFLGCVLHLRGGKAARAYRRITIDNAKLDEIDGFDQDIEKEGSPFGLAWKRTEGAVFRKIIVGTTPKLAGLSHVDARYVQAQHRFDYHIPCLHCDHEHPLAWAGKGDKKEPGGFSWRAEDTDAVGHVCPGCGAIYAQSEYLAIWHHGRWIDGESGIWIDQGRIFDGAAEWRDTKFEFRNRQGELVDPPRHIAFHVWTAYSPQSTWAEIVREFLSAQKKAAEGDKTLLKTFTNTTLGECWEEEVERGDPNLLEQRAEDYPLRIVPSSVVLLVAGVDVQGDRFEVVVWGLGRGEESWAVDYHVINNINPFNDADWDRLDVYLSTRFPHAKGGTMRIEMAAVDTGYATHHAYRFCRHREARRIYATKGDAMEGKDILSRRTLVDVKQRTGLPIKNGCKLWWIGTDSAKDLIHGRLQLEQPGPGYMHLSKHLPKTFFDQIVSEVRVTNKVGGQYSHKWVKPSSATRNEVLDCTSMSLFCVEMLKRRYPRNPEQLWNELARAIAQPGLFDDPVEAKPEVSAPSPPPPLLRKPSLLSNFPRFET